MASPFAEWLERVLTHGESFQTAEPIPTSADRVDAVPLLRIAHERHALSIAGPALPFIPESAWQAAKLLAAACWKLVGEPSEEPLPTIVVPRASDSDHLSVDLTLRFACTVYRRATTRDLTLPLAGELESVLRHWPLSGVLAGLDGEPTAPPDFDGHPGLQLLYAERSVKSAQPGWIPKEGLAREWAERVFAERDKSLPVRPNPEDDRRG